MTVPLQKELIELLQDPETTKVLATLDEDGFPHAVVKQSLQPGEDGNLYYRELIESSRTNRNMVRSLWFDRTVAIAVRAKSGASYQIKGRPVKCHITGEIFRQHYVAIRERLGDVDLAAVWVIEPFEVTDQSLATRRSHEEARHPYFNHLDRLARLPGARQDAA